MLQHFFNSGDFLRSIRSFEAVDFLCILLLIFFFAVFIFPEHEDFVPHLSLFELRELGILDILEYDVDILVNQLFVFDLIVFLRFLVCKALNEISHCSSWRLSRALELEQKLHVIFGRH